MGGQSRGHESGPGAHVGLHEGVEVELLVEVFRKARTQEDSMCKGPGVNRKPAPSEQFLIIIKQESTN